MGKRLLAVLSVLVLAPCVLLLVGSRRAYPQLSRLEHGWPVLDDKKRLLEIASTHEGPPGPPHEHPLDRTIETRMEALRRLLDLQSAERRRAIRATGRKGTGIDHRHVAVKSCSPERVVLVATLSEEADLPGRHPWFWQPRYNSDAQDYWSMDLLEFDRRGNLLSWAPSD